MGMTLYGVEKPLKSVAMEKDSTRPPKCPRDAIKRHAAEKLVPYIAREKDSTITSARLVASR